MSEKHHRGQVYLAVHKSDLPGNLMYVIIDDRSLFDLIDLPEGGNVKVRHKVITGEHYIVFQYFSPVLSKIDYAMFSMAFDFKRFVEVRQTVNASDGIT